MPTEQAELLLLLQPSLPTVRAQNSAVPVRRGRRKGEPFQEKGGQLAPAICHQGPGAEGALQAGGGSACWHLQALAIAPSALQSLQSPGAAAPTCC